jgi:transcriptional regulator with XRE-family HTH domain
MSRSVPPTNWKRYGQWIARKREEKGISQEDAANRVSQFRSKPMHRQTWYRIEHGGQTKRDTVIAMAKAVGANVDEALTEAGFQPLSNPPLPGADLLLSYYNTLPEQQARDLLNIAKVMSEQYSTKTNIDRARRPKKS